MELWNADSSCGVSIRYSNKEKEVFAHGEHFLSGEWFAVIVLIWGPQCPHQKG